MARLPRYESQLLEEGEGSLALLGNALVLLGLVEERLRAVSRYSGLGYMVNPALEDIARIRILLCHQQHEIVRRLPSSARPNGS